MAQQVVEETALATRTEQSAELAPTAAAAEKQYEIQSAIAVAKRFPRNEDQAFGRLMKAADRTSFAEDAAYKFPRGGQPVEGASVNLAREAARVWGNIRYGLEIVRDDDVSRQIRGWAWDMESNTKVTAEDDFQKLIQRRAKSGGGTTWVTPDERDLRELTNRRGAILVRNCLLQLLPKDLIEDALDQCKVTLQKGAASDPDAARKKIILAFSSLNITPEMLEARAGHPLKECSPAEIAELRTIYKSIADGNSTWTDYATTEVKAAPTVQRMSAQEKKSAAAAGPTPVAPAGETVTLGPVGVKDVAPFLNGFLVTLSNGQQVETEVELDAVEFERFKDTDHKLTVRCVKQGDALRVQSFAIAD